MAISSGTRLGPYEITAQIGEGGMGQVYRARDTKLDRDVAIKILPEAFAHDADRLARFQREAKTLASLNHPNIAIIHGLEQAGDVHALVMELVEGEDLSQRIARGAIPVDEALPLAKQIAEALEAAHEQGIIHRDLKPANIKVRPDGTVKVLDFGLAKAMEPASAPSASAGQALSQAPTITTPAMTQAGVVLGTAAYMSPEQAKGRRVDRRSDVWALGCILFEMLSGRRAFEGEDIADTLGNVLKVEPDWSRMPGNVPGHVVAAIRACLAKNPTQRLDSAQSFRLALDGVLAARTGGTQHEPTPRARKQRVLHMTVACLGGAVAASLLALVLWPEPSITAVTRTVVPQLAGQPLRLGNTSTVIALSPDGSRIAYRAILEDQREALVTRALDSMETTVLSAGVATGYTPAFSPDGAWIAFNDQSDATIKRVAVSGGRATTIANVPMGFLNGLTWTSANELVFGTSVSSGLWRVPADGGEPELITTLREAAGESNHEWPAVLPGRDDIVFTVRHEQDTADDADIAVWDAESGAHRTVIAGGSSPRYVSTGHLVFARSGTLAAVPFDVELLEVTGTPVTVTEGVVTKPGSGAADYAVAANGSLLYLAGDVDFNAGEVGTLVFSTLDGEFVSIPAAQRSYARPRLSPHKDRIAVEVTERADRATTTHIWVINAATGIGQQITYEGNRNQFPVWSPDGATVVFSSNRDEKWGIYRKAIDNSGPAELVAALGQRAVPTDISSTGILLFHQRNDTDDFDIWTLDLMGGGAPEVFVSDAGNEGAAWFSPGGDWVVYTSLDAVAGPAFVRRYPASEGGLQRLSDGPAATAVWSDAGDIYYIVPRRSGELVRVTAETGSTVSVLARQTLFQVIAAGFQAGNTIGSDAAPFDVDPSGNRLLFVHTGSPDVADVEADLVLVQNWTSELQRLVPAP
jgi:serine/threonine-protein kinase